jgi:hypothetical protein
MMVPPPVRRGGNPIKVDERDGNSPHTVETNSRRSRESPPDGADVGGAVPRPIVGW